MTTFPKQRLIRHGATARSQRGMSLVELMVAMTVGLFLMGAVGLIYVNTSTSSRSNTLESQMNEDATLALQLLQQQVRLAGFSNVNTTGARLFPGRAVFGCDFGFTAPGSDFTSLACNSTPPPPLPSADPVTTTIANADAFAVRYEASTLNSQTVTSSTGVLSPGNCAHESITAWNALAEGAASAAVMTLADNRYYIARDTDGTPSLFCRGRTGATFGTATALIPNIEDLQVLYAVTSLPVANQPIPHQVAGYVTASHSVLGTTTPTNWSRVAAMRICIVARTATPVPSGDNKLVDLGTYTDCNGVAKTSTDRYIRRAYVTTVQLRNLRPGLPANFTSGGPNSWAYLYEN